MACLTVGVVGGQHLSGFVGVGGGIEGSAAVIAGGAVGNDTGTGFFGEISCSAEAGPFGGYAEGRMGLDGTGGGSGGAAFGAGLGCDAWGQFQIQFF